MFDVVSLPWPSGPAPEFRDWLTEADGHGDEPAATSGDPMVPDDIDFVIAPPPN